MNSVNPHSESTLPLGTKNNYSETPEMENEKKVGTPEA
jgi:hypothetical protein